MKENFKTVKDCIDFLIKNKKELVAFKKATYKFSEPHVSTDSHEVTKSLMTSHKDDLTAGVIKRTIIGNTYLWLDKHDDVHIPGIFTRSISDRQDKIWHLHDHEQKITSKVGKPVSIYEKSVAWADLGIMKAGQTVCLMMDTNILKSYNELVYSGYLDKEINQHSVGMGYVAIDLAVNDPLQKEEYATWKKHIDKIGNQEEAIKQGFFWAVTEAKLSEISAVLAGSNELTNTIENKAKELIAQEPAKGIDFSAMNKNFSLKN